MQPARIPADASWACPACGDARVAGVLDVREGMFGSGETFTYVRCAPCGTLRIAHVPGDLGRHYPPHYYSRAVDPVRALRGPAGRLAAAVVRSGLGGRGRVLALAARAPHREVRGLCAAVRGLARAGAGPRATVLDVGGGAGVLVHALALAGLPSPLAVDPYAAPRALPSGARVAAGDAASVTGRFDVVAFHHSLEHMVDPVGALAGALPRLAPGGRALVRCPTASSRAFARYGADWVALDAPRHLFVPTRAGMEALAARAGWAVEAVADDATTLQCWGSRQNRRGVALMSPASRMRTPWRPRVDWLRMPWWAWRTRRDNRACRGDQACWILRPAAAAKRTTEGL